MQKVSRHARALRTLGFERMDEVAEITMNRRTERRFEQMNVHTQLGRLSRKDRRRFKQAFETPAFLTIRGNPDKTYATDEMNGHWVIEGEFDTTALEKLGFEDSAEYVSVAIAMPPLPAERLN